MQRLQLARLIGVCSLFAASSLYAWDEYTSWDAYWCATERPDCYILDVRTDEEWRWVGHPGANKLSDGAELQGKVVNLSWQVTRNGELVDNWRFLTDVRKAFGKPAGDLEFVTMCRSGGRSKAAADALEAAGYVAHNMTHGFEGSKDALGYRTVNGWKVDGLPYNYSATDAYEPEIRLLRHRYHR
jgi:rhodanese-related sulfurtransferase